MLQTTTRNYKLPVVSWYTGIRAYEIIVLAQYKAKQTMRWVSKATMKFCLFYVVSLSCSGARMAKNKSTLQKGNVEIGIIKDKTSLMTQQSSMLVLLPNNVMDNIKKIEFRLFASTVFKFEWKYMITLFLVKEGLQNFQNYLM